MIKTNQNSELNSYSIIHKLNTIQKNQLHTLMKKMWWTKDRTKEEIEIMLKNSISFALIENNTLSLVGYARILTDKMKYAFIFDVMLEEQLRGKGFGKLLMHSILTHPQFKNVKNFELTCKEDMMGFYKNFGFSNDYGDIRCMRIKRQ